MYIRKTTKSHKGKSYSNYLLVESVSTPKGPRQRIICSLGSLAPAPAEQWLGLAHRLAASLQGQTSLPAADSPVEALAEKVRRAPGVRRKQAEAGPTLPVDTEQVTVEAAREAGSVHVGHQMWGQLGLHEILARGDFPTVRASSPKS